MEGKIVVFQELFELGMFVYVIDSLGHRRKVYVKNEAEKQRLLAQNAKLRKQLATKKKKKIVHKKR